MTKKPTEKLKSLHQSKHVPDLFPDFSDYSAYSLDTLVKKLEALKEEGYSDIRVLMDTDPCYGYFSIAFNAESVREETDEEFEARVLSWQEHQRAERDMRKVMKAKREERDRKEFERLKKKFGSA